MLNQPPTNWQSHQCLLSLKNHTLTSVFQPILTKDWKTFGYEALLRVSNINETSSLTPPDEFIDSFSGKQRTLLEQLIIELHLQNYADSWFIDEKLFINVSPGSLITLSQSFETKYFLKQLLSNLGIPQKSIVLEVKECASPDEAALKSSCNKSVLGQVLLALDDVTMCDLDTLRMGSLKPAIIKIDHSLIGEECNETANRKLEKFIKQCHRQGAMVVAEGIEDRATYLKALALGVDLFQGYFISRPLPIEKLHL
ncbi:EAL domain-containing protein [Ferrimonas sp.]|uniref:EAL domain-containing protein n=1 Tax=Ferrimonas sp. TaxID=2080861 RepID=UPI003A8D4123